MRRRTLAWRNRLLSATTVLIYMMLTQLLIADPIGRADFHYGTVITLGYGHLLGAAFFGRERLLGALTQAAKRMTGKREEWLEHLSPDALSRLVWLCLLILLLLIYAGYSFLLSWGAGLALAMLAISTWHSVENDLALESTYGSQLRLGALSISPARHLSAVGITAVLLAWGSAAVFEHSAAAWAVYALRATATLCGAFMVLRAKGSRSEWKGLFLIGASALSPHWILGRGEVGLSDLFTTSVLYHLVSWGWLSIERCRRSDTRPRMARDLVVIHLIPLFLLAGTFAWPEAWGQSLRDSFLSPFVYLFWSAGHVLQTAWLRGLPELAPIGRRS